MKPNPLDVLCKAAHALGQVVIYTPKGDNERGPRFVSGTDPRGVK